jgi:Ras-related protein Rab-7A
MSFIKIVLIGDSSCGKTSVMQQYVNRRFAADFRPTVGTDFLSKAVIVDNETVNVNLWDTAGQERFRSLTTSYYKGSEVCVVVFDLTNAETFDHVEEWIDEFKRVCHVESGEKFPICVVGNKSDLEQERVIPKMEAMRYCQSKGWMYHETSAKLADGIDTMFKECANAAVARRKQKNYLDEFSVNNNGGGSGGSGAPNGGVQRAKLVPVGKQQYNSSGDNNSGDKKKFGCAGCGNGGD